MTVIWDSVKSKNRLRRALVHGTQPYPYRRTCDCAVVDGHCDRDRHVAEYVCRRAVTDPGPRQQGTARRPSPESSYASVRARVAT